MSRTHETLDDLFNDIATSIQEKIGDDTPIVADNFPEAIDEIPTGGGGKESGVFFLDYDGTIIETWEASSVASKTTLPDNPTHEGLVAQGWNWDLQHIKDYIATYDNSMVYVRQMYKTASGLTEIDVVMNKVTGKTITCNMVGNKNWGDGTIDALTTHTYVDYGEYTITCDGTTIPQGSSSSGGMFLSSTSNINRYWCSAIRLGEGVTSIGTYAFYCCRSITNITIPQGVTNIDSHAFDNCYSLANITIPQGVTSIGTYAFNSCYSLTNITIPQGVTSIDTYTFSTCHSLTNITIPQGVTKIDTYAIQYCYSLTNITIPQGVTSIGSNAFNNNYSLKVYDFTSATTIPTLFTANAFTNINGQCKILVPSALYNNWIASTNWSTYADYIYAV